MLYLFNLLCGFVQIRISGPYIQRFLNLLSRRNIPFWGLNYIDTYEITLFLRAEFFKALRPIARRTMCKVKILKKRGFPFFMQKFKGRAALFCGIIVFTTLIWVLTSFVWVIDITGGDAELRHMVREQLVFNGLRIGAYSHGIKYDELKNDVLLTFPELSNLTVNISGSRATIELHMKSPKPEIIDYTTPSNIISDFDGIITSITITSGMPEVSPGDTVMRGQLLASGYMTGRTGSTLQVRALGDIRARTWETYRITMPDKTQKKHYTGTSKKLYSLIFGKKRMNLYFGTGNSYDTCDKIIERVQLTLPFGITVPLAMETITLREYTVREYTPSNDEFKNYLSVNAEKYIEFGDEDTLLSFDKNFTVTDGRPTLNYTAECERKIGVEQMIPKASEN